MSKHNTPYKTGQVSKRLSLWPIKPKDALETMLKTPLSGKRPRAKPEAGRKAE